MKTLRLSATAIVLGALMGGVSFGQSGELRSQGEVGETIEAQARSVVEAAVQDAVEGAVRGVAATAVERTVGDICYRVVRGVVDGIVRGIVDSAVEAAIEATQEPVEASEPPLGGGDQSGFVCGNW